MKDESKQWHWQEQGTAWKGVGIYHVTLTVPSREPILGKLVIPENDPKQARVERTEMGNALLMCLRSISEYHPEIQTLQYCLMPDHLHAIWYVRQAMPHGIRYVAQAFGRAAKKLGRACSYCRLSDGAMNEKEIFRLSDGAMNEKEIFHLSDGAINEKELLSSIVSAGSRVNPLREKIGEEAYKHIPPIFTEVPFIRPMSRKGQLQTMIRYVQMNPERLATKHLMPEYFRVQEGIEIAGRMYCGVGNADLLQRAKYLPVHVRRMMVEEAEHGDNTRLRDYMNGCVIAARNGAVMVSPFISPKEKEVMDVLLKEDLPFIYIADNGFRDYYKPQDSLFDAVARKKVLILSPWNYDPQKKHVSRAECVEMNKMAEEICAWN